MADVSFEDMVCGVEGPSFEDMVSPEEVSFESMVGVTEPTFVTPATDAPRPPTHPMTLYEMQMETYKTQLGEVSPLETKPLVTDEMKQGFMETLKGYSQLSMQPLGVEKGIADFALSIPGFLTGLATAGQRMAKATLDQLVLGQTLNIEELYNVASEGMEAGMRFFEPAKELLIGKPTPTAQLVGATAMAPLTALSAVGHSVAEWPRFEDYPNIRGIARFVGDVAGFLALGMMYRGPRAELTKKAGEIVRKADEIRSREQLVDGIPDEAIKRAQERVLEVEKQQVELEAEALVKDIETKIDLKEVLKESLRKKGKEVKEAKAKVEVPEVEIPKFKMTEDAIEFGEKATPEQVSRLKELRDEAYRAARELKERGDPDAAMEKATEGQFYREAVEVAEKKMPPREPAKVLHFDESTTDTAYWDNLLRTEEASIVRMSPDRYMKEVTDIQGITLKETMRLVPEELVSEYAERMRKGEKAPLPILDYVEASQEGRARVLAAKKLGDTEVPVVVRGRPTRPVEAEIDWFGEREPDIKAREALAELEKITELDRQTGVEVPEIKGERSPFYQTVEETGVYRKLYEERPKAVSEDVELFTQKLINDVNRAYHEDAAIDIAQTRDTLSQLASRADELRMNFLKPEDFAAWRETVSDAAEWARGLRSKIERRKGVTLYTGIPLQEAPRVIRDVYKGVKNLFRNRKIFDEIGLWLGRDGKWRFEIDDNKIVLSKPILKKGERWSGRLDDVLHYPDLYEAMPGIRGMKLEIGPHLDPDFANVYYPELNKLVLERLDRRGLVHELQHIVNENLGAFTGAGLEAGREAYFRAPGEMEARLAEVRLDMTMKEREAIPPWETLDKMLMEEGVPIREGVKLYAGVPLDAMGKAIVDGAKRFKGYVEHARGVKRFKPLDAARLLNEEFKRSFIDRSGNIRLELLDKLGDIGYEAVQKMYLTKGANSLAANTLKQMRKEVYSGLSKAEKVVLDKIILAERMADIGRYKTEKEFKFPEGLKPTETAAYLELFPQLEKLAPERAQLISERARAYFEWMKRPLKDMLDAELITQEEFNNLVSHNYRRIKLVDIFDRRYQAKIGKRKRTVYDSGVEALAKGRETDIYEPSSEIMALEVFNRAYGRILNNGANKALLDVARSDPKNPFVRARIKGQSIPSGWQRFFVYEGGERKSIYLSPEMSREWIVSNPEISYRTGQFLRYTSGSPVLRTFATGVNWGFALANLPRDIMHVFFAGRMFDGKEWKSVYSPHLPIFLPQIGMDLARTFTDAATRGKRYQKYIEEGGGMEFLVHQGRPFARGRRLEGPFDKVMDFMGYFGETTEIMTRLALRERVIRRRAKEQGLSMKEARENKDITREATFAARDYMDFGQGGGITKAADNAMPYLNAAVQGTRGLWRTAVDNPALFSYKVAQIGAATTLLYAAMRNHAPKTAESLQGSIAMQNNLCIPLGDGFSFEDEKGQTRYIYFKIPLDPSQKFFKTFFEGAYDKYAGYEVDVERITNNILEQSPVGTSNLPPTLTGTLGYMYNKDFWLNEDIWKKTDRPFKWPVSKEEFIPGVTPEAFVDLGEVTGLSPERAQYAVEELTTSGTMWSYLLGEGYDELFADVPEEKKEQHIAMVLGEIPIVKRFIGITNPYSKYATGIDEAAEAVTADHWKQRRKLDRLTEGYLFEKSVERKEVFKHIRSFKEPRVRDRLQDRFDFQYAIRDLPERSWWLRLQHLDPEVRAERYHARVQAASPEERSRLVRDEATIGAAGGFFSDAFWDELNKLRRRKEVAE